MENTQKIISVIQKELNTNQIAREATEIMAKRAEELNFTPEQWQQAKISFMTSIFYKIALEHEDIKQRIAEDVYKMYNEE